MKLIIRPFRLQKAGNTFEECEDQSFHVFLKSGQDAYELSDRSLSVVGVADGATEGILSGKWAEILIKTVCRSKNSSPDIRSLVEKASKAWDSWMKNYLTEREKHNKPIKWYEEPGLKAGSFSTLLRLVLSDSGRSEGGDWHAIAVGDSCLFHIREGELIRSFPIENSSSFNNSPSLVSSNPSRNKDLIELSKMLSGEWRSHDSFYLITDALACWFLKENEARNSPWASYPFIKNSNKINFESWIDHLRRSDKIKNDDVTLIHIEVDK